MINRYKFAIIYLFFVIFTVFFYLNKELFLNYVNNFSFYKKVDKLKINGYINTNLTGYNISGLELGNYDKLNLKILKDKELDYNGYITYKYLYNLGNKYLLDGYKKIYQNETGYIENLEKSIFFYKKSLKLIPSYSSKEYILNNLGKINNLLSFLYLYKCDSLFLNMLGNLNKLFFYLDNINVVLKKQLGELKKWDRYNFLKTCINGFKKDANSNILNIYSNKLFFNKVEFGLIELFKQYQNNELICYKNSNLINLKYKSSIDSSLKYFIEFKKTQSDLLLLFKKASIVQMTKLCKGKNKISDKQNKKNKKMQDNFDKLQDLLKKENKKKKKEFKKDNALNKKYDKLGKDMKNKINSLKKGNKELIKQIEGIKSVDNYSSLNYLKKLFKTFFGDKKAFQEKKYNIIGK